MPRKFGEIPCTLEVKAVQKERGSRQTYEKSITTGSTNDAIRPKTVEFIAQLDEATVVISICSSPDLAIDIKNCVF